MLKTEQTFTKLFLLIAMLFFLFCVASYFSFKFFIIDTQNIDIYNQIWIALSVLALFILVLIYLSIKSISNKLSKDVGELQQYLDNINNKNYDSIIKINTFQEFLQMSLILKNIVKRLNQKEKKSSKK